MQKNALRVSLGEHSYDVLFMADDYREEFFLSAPDASVAVIVSNDVVAEIYLNSLKLALRNRYKKIHIIILPDGEKNKNWTSLQSIFDKLINLECDRKTVLFALGGGVVGDVTGFAAACYMRGVPFVQVPTTLLAQVDSSVGGKTAINHDLGKNMIGAFYQPHLVVCNARTLDTLSDRELGSGLAEVIKYGPILDMHFMDWLDANINAVLDREPDALLYAVRRSCELKSRVVGLDERESGLRAILNFGHTFGHAIETGMGYGVWLHGEGVAAGMVMAAELSHRLGMVDAAFVERLKALIQRAGLPIKGPVIDPKDNAGRYLELMRIDKKSEAGEIRFVLIDGPGKAVVRPAPDALVREVIDACCA